MGLQLKITHSRFIGLNFKKFKILFDQINLSFSRNKPFESNKINRVCNFFVLREKKNKTFIYLKLHCYLCWVNPTAISQQPKANLAIACHVSLVFSGLLLGIYAVHIICCLGCFISFPVKTPNLNNPLLCTYTSA